MIDTTSFFIWMTTALCCAVVELTGRSTNRWFFLGCGAFAAAIGSLFALLVELQLCVFLIVSVACWFCGRIITTYAQKSKYSKPQDLIGAYACVVRPIAPGVPGAVVVNGRIWLAQSDTPAAVLVGAQVLVVGGHDEFVIVRQLVLEIGQPTQS